MFGAPVFYRQWLEWEHEDGVTKTVLVMEMTAEAFVRKKARIPEPKVLEAIRREGLARAAEAGITPDKVRIVPARPYSN